MTRLHVCVALGHATMQAHYLYLAYQQSNKRVSVTISLSRPIPYTASHLQQLLVILTGGEMAFKMISRTVAELPWQIFYGELVHVYAIADNNCIVIIDGPDTSSETLEALASAGRAVKVILTHGATSRGVLRLKHELNAEIFLHYADRHNTWLTIDPRECTLWDGNELYLTPTVRVVHTPGHTKGSCCVYYPENGGMLFTGDAVYGDRHGNIRPPDASGSDWNTHENMASLNELCNHFQFEMILPFHFDIIFSEARSKLQAALVTFPAL